MNRIDSATADLLDALMAEPADPLDSLMAETEAPPVDTWDYVMAAHGDIKQTIPFPARPAYDELLARVQQPKEFEDRLSASLFLASTMRVSEDYAYDLQEELGRHLFKEPLSPGQIVTRAMANEDLIGRYIEAWNSLVDSQRPVEPPPFWQEMVNQAAIGMATVESGAAESVRRGLERQPEYSPFSYGTGFMTAEQRGRQAEQWSENARALWEIAKSPDLTLQRDDLLSKVLGMGAQTLSYITATTVASLGFGPMGGFAVGWMVEGNSAYRTALDEGAPEETARKIGMAVGVVSGAIESFGFKWSDKLMAAATAKIKNRLLRGGADLTIGSITEALEEAGQEISALTGEAVYKDTDWGQAARRVLAAAGGGALLGGVFKTTGAAVRGVTEASPMSEQRRALRVLAAEGELNEQMVGELEQTAQMAVEEEAAGGKETVEAAAAPVPAEAAPAGAAGAEAVAPEVPAAAAAEAGEEVTPAQVAPQVAREEVESPETPQLTSARQAMLEDDYRAVMGREGVNSKEKQSFRQWHEQAINEGLPEQALRLAAEVSAKPRLLSPVETAGVVVKLAQVKKEHGDLMGRIGQSADAATTADLSARVGTVEAEFEALYQALYRNGSEAGRRLAAQKLTINQDFSLVAVKARAKAAKGAELTVKETAKLTDLTNRLSEQTEKVAALEKELNKLKAEQMLKRLKGAQKLAKMSAAERAADKEVKLKKVRELMEAGCY